MKEDVFTYISNCLNEESLSHSFLIESCNSDDLIKLVLDFLHKENLIQTNNPVNNLNLLVIEPDGKEIRSMEIDNLRARFSTLPSNNKYNIYIIKEAEKLNISASNKLLKFLEEPTDYVVGFLLVGEEAQVLPTIKSRCQYFKQTSSQITASFSATNAFLEYFKAPTFDKQIAIRVLIKDMERFEVISIISSIINELSVGILNPDQKISDRSSNILLLDKILHLLKSNVNIELVFDKLFIEVR